MQVGRAEGRVFGKSVDINMHEIIFKSVGQIQGEMP